MSQVIQQLNSLYQYLDRLYPQGAALASAGKLQLACEQIAPKFCQLYQQQPGLMQAQLSLSAANHSVLANLALKQAVIILVLAQQGHWPLSLQEQILSASFAGLISLDPQQFSDTTDDSSIKDPWMTTLRSHQAHLPAIWLQLFASCCRLRQQAPVWQQDPLASVLLLAYQLTLPLVLPNSAGKIGFETTFRQLWRQSTGVMQTLLQSLSKTGANLHQLGRFCTDSIGAVAFITEAEPNLQGYLFDLNLKSLSAEPVALAGSGMQLLPARPCRDPAWLALLVRQAHDLLDTADPQPMSLPLIQQLNPDWPISRQVNFLQQHPGFSALLRQAAAQLSRQATQIEDLRHALALIGTEQLPSLLRLSWLAQQTALCVQPWQPWFQQLEQVFCQMLQLLAHQTKNVALSANQAKLIAASVSLQLQQHDELRHQPLYRAGRQMQSMAEACRKLIWHDPDTLRHIAQLLAATGASVLWQDAAMQWRAPPEIQAEYSQQQSAQLLLQLAWVLTEVYFFGDTPAQIQLDALYRNARHALDLPAISLSQWLEQLQQHTTAFWPLQPKM